MTNNQFSDMKMSAYKVCVLGKYDNQDLKTIWDGISTLEREREKKSQRAMESIAKKRKDNPNYARAMENGKQKQYYVKKNDR